MRVFADLGKVLRARAGGWSKGLRVSLSVTNLADARERVVDATGATPVGFQPGYLDPLGRTVTLGVRKVF
jgi:iron complex outermembrane recepter protein